MHLDRSHPLGPLLHGLSERNGNLDWARQQLPLCSRGSFGGHQLTLAGRASCDLLVHPRVRLLEPLLEADLRLPAKALLDEGVVAVSTPDALGSVQLVSAAKP